MKLKVREKGRRALWLYVPNWLMLKILKRRLPGAALDDRRVKKLLRRYRGMTVLEVNEQGGDYVEIRL